MFTTISIIILLVFSYLYYSCKKTNSDYKGLPFVIYRCKKCDPIHGTDAPDEGWISGSYCDKCNARAGSIKNLKEHIKEQGYTKEDLFG